VSAPPVHRVRIDIDESLLDPDALKVVRRLVRFGFEAYLVGGGVRDLLLGCRPKDFDVATAARPEQVRRLFRNSHIIGRRFRLVHVVFGVGKVIEVATFRRCPETEDTRAETEAMLIRSDNAYGQAHEDALRRDLTINALLYDVQKHEVLDFVGGMPDIHQRVIRTIGDPRTRFLEDPVRMLRAIKFSARLNLGMVPELYDAMVLVRETLTVVAKPRLLEEILKLLRSGASHRAFWLLWETGLLHVFLPEVAVLLDDASENVDGCERFWRMLTQVDHRTAQRGAPFDDMTLLTILLLEPIVEALEGQRDRLSAAMEVARPIFQRLAVPRRMADGVCRVAADLYAPRPRKSKRIAKTELYKAALDVHAIAQASRESEP